jgi:(2Fe-2S) ferredoxin
MGKELKTPESVIYVCAGSKCSKKGSKDIGKQFRQLIKDNGYKNEVEVIKTECTDRCKFAPIVCFQPQNTWYHEVDFLDVKSIFDEEINKKQ